MTSSLDEILAQDVYESRVWIDDDLLQDEGIIVLLPSEEPAVPSIRNISVTVPGMHGAYDFGGYLDPREITLHLVFRRQSYSSLKRQIRTFNRRFFDEYGRPKLVKLRFGDELDKYYNVRLTDKIPVERSANRGFLTVNLTAYDPYAYSIVNANDVVWGSEEVTFEWSYMLGMDGSGGSHMVTRPQAIDIFNDGEVTRPVIEIDGSARGLVISANGNRFEVPDFKDSEWIIGGDDYVVIRNGIDDLGAIYGDFIHLTNGVNTVEITGSYLDFEMSIKYRDKYI